MADDDIDWYALSNGLSTVFPDGTLSHGIEEESVTSDDLTADALFKLNDEQRAVFGLFEAKKSYKQIAFELDIPIGTVRSRLHRARAKLARLPDIRSEG